jgi:hypothetical protein
VCSFILKKIWENRKKQKNQKAYPGTAMSARKIYFVFEVKFKKKGASKIISIKYSDSSHFNVLEKIPKKFHRNDNYIHFNIEWR